MTIEILTIIFISASIYVFYIFLIKEQKKEGSVEKMFGKKNLDVYLLVGIAELVITCIIVTSTLTMTFIGLDHGLVEENPIASTGFLYLGFSGVEAVQLLFYFIVFVGTWTLGSKLDMPWFSVIIFGILIAALSIDALHDYLMLRSIGVFI